MKQAIVNYSTRLKTLWIRMASRIEKLEGFQKRVCMRIALNEYKSYQVASWTSQLESAEFAKAEVCISSRTVYCAAAGNLAWGPHYNVGGQYNISESAVAMISHKIQPIETPSAVSKTSSFLLIESPCSPPVWYIF